MHFLVRSGSADRYAERRVAEYPEALRRAVVQDYLWAAEFGLAAFARKFAVRADTYGTGACLTRAVNQLVLVLFALNHKYLRRSTSVPHAVTLVRKNDWHSAR